MDEERFLRLHAQGLSDMDIAEALFGDRTKNGGQQVSRLRVRYGLPSNKAKRGPKADTSLDDEIRRLYEDDKLTCEQVAHRVGRKTPFVYDRLRKLGVTIDKRRGHYAAYVHPPADLAEVWAGTVQDKTLPSGGVLAQGSAVRVAQHYGVSPQVATRWLKESAILKDRLPQAETWKSLYEAGMSCDAIAARVGVTNPNTVSKYLKRQGVGVKNGYSHRQQEVADFISAFGVSIERDNKTVLGGKHLDVYCPDQKVAVEYNGTYWHSHPMLLAKGLSEGQAKSYHLDKTLGCERAGVRLIHVWEHLWADPRKRPVYENMIRHALGFTGNRVGARQTRVEKRPASTMRRFFEENNIQGYRQARWAYVLVDNRTGLDLMCYTTGHAYFGNGAYDLEIARGACRLGWSVSGGATKLWKAIIADNPGVNSIVYYVDLNHYNGSSVSVLPGMALVKAGEPSLWNWWPKLGAMKNREPNRHREIMEAYKTGDAIPVWNAGTAVYVWRRPSPCGPPPDRPE